MWNELIDQSWIIFVGNVLKQQHRNVAFRYSVSDLGDLQFHLDGMRYALERARVPKLEWILTGCYIACASRQNLNDEQHPGKIAEVKQTSRHRAQQKHRPLVCPCDHFRSHMHLFSADIVERICYLGRLREFN